MKNLDIISGLILASVTLACTDDTGSDGDNSSGGQQASSGGDTGSGGTSSGDQFAELDEAECMSAESCTPSTAYEMGDLSDAGEFAGCYYSGDDAVLCGDALTCAKSSTDSCKVFRNTCTPEDWVQVSCSSDGCPDINGNAGGNGGAAP